MNDIEFPPLPDLGSQWTPYWTKVVHEQMQSYARAAVEADRAQRVPEGCYLSWGGFNIHGDSKSIQEVNRLMHEAGTVPDLKAMLAQSYKELAKEAPELCDPSCKTYDVAAMVMSDCGHSTNNQRLLDRIAARIDKHVESLLASTPAPAQQEKVAFCHEKDAQMPTLAEMAAAHQPVERKPMTDELLAREASAAEVSAVGLEDSHFADGYVSGFRRAERHHGIKE